MKKLKTLLKDFKIIKEQQESVVITDGRLAVLVDKQLVDELQLPIVEDERIKQEFNQVWHHFYVSDQNFYITQLYKQYWRTRWQYADVRISDEYIAILEQLQQNCRKIRFARINFGTIGIWCWDKKIWLFLTK